MSNLSPDSGIAARQMTKRLRIAASLAVVSGLFALAVALTMVGVRLGSGQGKPPASQELDRLHEGLSAQPGDERLKESLRAEDRRLRSAHFRQRLFYRRGGWLLLIGAAAFIACGHWYLTLRDQALPAKSRRDPDAVSVEQRRARSAVLGAGAVLVAGLAVLAVLGPSAPQAGEETTPVERAGPVEQPERSLRFRDNWPRFRGADGCGVAGPGPWPTDWSGSDGRNILWKCELPLPGKSSPVVWADYVLVTGGTSEKQGLVCVDRASGAIVWTSILRRPPPMRTRLDGTGAVDVDEEPLSVPDDTGWAAPTPATDGRRIYVTYATADVASFDFRGNQLWARNFGKPDSVYGLASSLVVYKDLVIYQLDQGGFGEDGRSAIHWLDAKTGKTVISVKRPVPNSWTTPIVAETGSGPQLITAADPWVIGYDAGIGAELWRAKGIQGDVAPSPIYAAGLVFAANTYSKLLAIRPDGMGDVTSSHVAWSGEQSLPDVCSPVSDGKLLLLASPGGVLTAWDAATGKAAWEHETSGEFSASPTLAGGLVYLPSTKGKTFIFELGQEFRLVSSPELGEAVHASPAFGDGCIFIRGEKHLFCIGPAQAPASAKETQ